ncbi:hypothetical protein [Candidatus Villigracilis saccharophilus]|uniref:hypothetical protein n=1 Tax=Candidatus Villigracilis saccharophilus TaxID=3140684 RepID=UPI00313748A2|nr:hypothetical protein [Anaerolineales bacterium]
MNKYISAFFIIFFLSACYTPTPPPPYNRYTPSKASGIHLEFDYPSSWIVSENTQDMDYIFIGLTDSQSNTVPTRSPNDPHGTPSDFRRIRILAVTRPGQTLASRFNEYKQGGSNENWIMQLNEYKTTVDGYDANALEYQIQPNASIDGNGYTSLMFEKSVFFAVKNQMYQITFLVSEKERGGEFEQGYEYFLNSLKIVP